MMRITKLVQNKSSSIEKRCDFAFLNDIELEELENLLTKAEHQSSRNIPETKQERINELLSKTEGNVIHSWLKQTTLTGKEPLRELYNQYGAYCESHGYRKESLVNFKNRLQEVGIKSESVL